MAIRVTTRHSEEFDIYTGTIDPSMSPYVRNIPDYVLKITTFYSELGIRSAMWTTPEWQTQKYLETSKPVEYVLELNSDRAVAYVDEVSWSDFLEGNRNEFTYSSTPTRYEDTSIIVETPITEEEVKIFRRYKTITGPENYELIEERIL